MKHGAWALLLAVLVAAPAHAQSSFAGTFLLQSQLGDDVEAAIKTATARMSFIIKPIARSRLRKVNKPHELIIVNATADSITIAYESSRPITTPNDGNVVTWRNEDNEAFKVWGKREGSALIQHFTANDGERDNQLRPSENGDTLQLRVTITSPRLKTPLTYRLVYLKKVRGS